MTQERDLLNEVFTSPLASPPSAGLTAHEIVRRGRRRKLRHNVLAATAAVATVGVVGGLALGLGSNGGVAERQDARLGAPVVSSAEQGNATSRDAQTLRSGLASVVAKVFAQGTTNEELIGYATTETAAGPSYGRSASASWSDSHGSVTFVVQRNSIALPHELVTCATAKGVIDCTSTADDKGTVTYFMTSAANPTGSRLAIRVLPDGSAVMITETLGRTNPNHVRGKKDGIIERRDTLVADDAALSALLDGLASF